MVFFFSENILHIFFSWKLLLIVVQWIGLIKKDIMEHYALIIDKKEKNTKSLKFVWKTKIVKGVQAEKWRGRRVSKLCRAANEISGFELTNRQPFSSDNINSFPYHKKQYIHKNGEGNWGTKPPLRRNAANRSTGTSLLGPWWISRLQIRLLRSPTRTINLFLSAFFFLNLTWTCCNLRLHKNLNFKLFL